MRRLMYLVMRYSRFSCKCFAMEESGDQVDGAVVFFKNLTEEDIACILLETTLSTWDMIWHNPLLLKPKLWKFGEIVRKISGADELFKEINKECAGSTLKRALLAVRNLPSPFTISILCALLAWLGPHCKRNSRDETMFLCKAVASVVYPTLEKLVR